MFDTDLLSGQDEIRFVSLGSNTVHFSKKVILGGVRIAKSKVETEPSLSLLLRSTVGSTLSKGFK